MTPEDVPAGPLLIDTDVATWLLTDAGQAEGWRPLLRGHLLTLSFVNVGELLALPASRLWGTTRTAEWREAIRRHFIVLPFDANITMHGRHFMSVTEDTYTEVEPMISG